MTTPADELRTAAQMLRTLAKSAIGNEQPWRYAKSSPDSSVRTATGWEVAYGQDQANLRYIAAMHPAVGAALADWLEATAASLDASTHPGWQETVAPHPLAVARAINAQS